MLGICHTYYHVINDLVSERATLGAINVIFQLLDLIYCWGNVSHSRDDNCIVHCVTDVNSLVHIYTDEVNADLNAESIQYFHLDSFRGSHLEPQETNQNQLEPNETNLKPAFAYQKTFDQKN